MNRIINGVAGYLVGLGVAKGDRIALYMANRPEWIMIYYAIAGIGAISVCVPGAYKKGEVKGVVRDSRSSMVVTSEDLLHQHKAVNECGVVGIPHKEYGEAVTAFITLKPGMTVDERSLISFCKERIANFKVPKAIHFVDDLPKTPQGKILRRELRKNAK